MTLLIFSDFTSPRLSFVLDYLFHDMLGIDYQITNHLSLFQQSDAPKLAYTSQIIDGIKLTPHPLLSENDICPQSIQPVEWKSMKLFFPVQDSAFPFDPFAVVFYLISRYEEYLPEAQLDEHQRYKITNTVAYQFGFHRVPVVNMIARALVELLQGQYANLTFTYPTYKKVLTYDVDIAYQYKGKDAIRFLGSLTKSLLQLNFSKVKKLLLTLLGVEVEDSFDSFSQHEAIAKEEQITPIHFMLTAKMGKFDRNISYKSRAFKSLIKQLSTFSQIGLHPSYHTFEKLSLLQKEKNRLEKITTHQITCSRQHFLRIKFPTTYQNLSAAGITDDYSLGWPDDVGFRASTTVPFNFFDLSNNAVTALKIHPLIMMDGALHKITANRNEFDDLYATLEKTVQQYGGEFVVLWHNSFGKK